MGFKKHKKVIDEHTIPATPKDAIQVLDIIIPEEDKEYLRTEENAAIKIHHSLGRWIRNNWGLWGDESPLKNYFLQHGINHPDDMSNDIIETYIKYLKTKSS